METTDPNLAMWDQPVEDFDLAKLDALILEFRNLNGLYEEASKLKAEAYARVEKVKALVLGVLNAANKTKYFVDGLGTAYKISRKVVRVPKEASAKSALFNHLQTQYGREVAIGLLTINHQSLNSFYNKEAELAEEQGRTDFALPGIEAPVVEESLGFRKG